MIQLHAQQWTSSGSPWKNIPGRGDAAVTQFPTPLFAALLVMFIFDRPFVQGRPHKRAQCALRTGLAKWPAKQNMFSVTSSVARRTENPSDRRSFPVPENSIRSHDESPGNGRYVSDVRRLSQAVADQSHHNHRRQGEEGLGVRLRTAPSIVSEMLPIRRKESLHIPSARRRSAPLAG